MGEIMNFLTGVKLCVPERVSISCPTCGTRHDLAILLVTVSDICDTEASNL